MSKEEKKKFGCFSGCISVNGSEIYVYNTTWCKKKKNLHEFLLTYYETNKMTYFEHNIGSISWYLYYLYS